MNERLHSRFARRMKVKGVVFWAAPCKSLCGAGDDELKRRVWD